MKQEKSTGSEAGESIEALRKLLEQERSARQRLETKLAESSYEFRSILNTSPALFWLKDTKNNIVYANAAAAAAMGCTPEEIEGRSTYELYPDEAASYYA